MEYFCKYVREVKSRKLRSHRYDCDHTELCAKRANIFGLLTGALKVYMLKKGWRGAPKIYILKSVGERHPKFTCSRGTQIKRNCVDQHNRIKF